MGRRPVVEPAFAHYYVPLMLPAVALLVLPLERGARGLTLALGAARLLGAGAAVAIALPVVHDMGRSGDEIAANVYGRETLALLQPADVVGAFLRRRQQPGDELFVVGAEPEYYWRSGLPSYRRWLFDYPAQIAPERFLPDMAGLCRDGPRFVVLTTRPVPSYARRCVDGRQYVERLRRGTIVVLERERALTRARPARRAPA